MKISFENWIGEYCVSKNSKRMFDESIMCYKLGAYRSAYLMSYIGFKLELRDRLIESRNIPGNFTHEEWKMQIIELLSDEDHWEGSLDRIILRNPDKNELVFDFSKRNSEINKYTYFKNIRNTCAHGKNETINYSTVEQFWNYLVDSFDKFNIGGDIKYIKSLVINSFDITKSEAKESYDSEIRFLSSMDHISVTQILNELFTEALKLDDRLIAQNLILFFKQLHDSKYENIQIGMDEFYKLNNNGLLACKKMILYYKTIGGFSQKIRSDTEYIKSVWAEYTNCFNQHIFIDFIWKGKWELFNIFYKENILDNQDYHVFFNQILRYPNAPFDFIYGDETFDSHILLEAGLGVALSERAKELNVRVFDEANRHESLIQLIARYSIINHSVYESIKYLISKRYTGSLIEKVNKELSGERNEDFKRFEKEHKLPSFFTGVTFV